MARLVTLPSYLQVPSVAALAVNNSIFDVGVVAAFGLVGYVMWRQEIPVAPLVITLLLSDEMENSLIRFADHLPRQTLASSVARLPLGLLLFTFFRIGLSLWGSLRGKSLVPRGE